MHPKSFKEPSDLFLLIEMMFIMIVKDVAKSSLEKVILYVSSDESSQELCGACTTASDEATGENCPAAPGVSYSVKESYRRAADVDTR